MTAQGSSQIQTHRRQNVKRLSLLVWDAYADIYTSFLKNIDGRGELLTLEDIAFLHEKSYDEIDQILRKKFGESYIRNRNIYFEHSQNPAINTLEFLGKKYLRPDGRPITRSGVYQIIRTMQIKMRELSEAIKRKEEEA